MDFQELRYEAEDGVLTVTLDLPSSRGVGIVFCV